jgi:transcriptional antiterminator RfaH
MPILPAEPDIYPDDLFAPGPGEPSQPWWAIYTLARREKELLRRLRALETPHYAPLVKRRSRSPGGRVRVSYVPLFPNYVFVRGSDDARRQALATGCVSRTLEISDGLALVRDLAQIRRLIAAEAPLLPESRLETGDPVRIRSGPLAGVEGVIIQRRGEERLLVSVGFLQQGASLLMEDFQVERM